MKAGDILYHNEYQYPDGSSGIKLLILLNIPKNEEPYLFCEVTSQQHFRSKTFGCNSYRQYFFIPATRDWFNKNTWIKLDTITGWKTASILKDKFDGKLDIKGKLSTNIFNAVKNCVRKIDTINNKYKKMIL